MSVRGTLPRRLDRGEAFFWFLDRVSSNNFVVIAEGAGELSATSLRAALERARGEHPLLSAAIRVGEDGCLWFVPAEGGAVALHEEPAGEDWRQQLLPYMVAPFELDEAPLIRAVRIDLPEAGAWVFALVFHHSIGDGRSASHLLLEILEHACGVDRPLARRADFLPMHDIFPPGLHGPAGEEHAASLKQVRRAEFKAQGKPDELPAFARVFGPAQPGLLTFHLNEQQVRRLAERARREHCTVNGALGAAQLLALHAAFGDENPRLLGQIHATDLRASFAQPVDHSTPGAYVSMLTSTQRVAGAGSFWQVAQGLTEDIRRQLRRGDAHQFFRLLPPPESFPPNEQGISAFAAMIGQWPVSNMLSNVGRLPKIYAAVGIRLEHLSFALCPNPSLVLFCTASTYEGRMTVTVNYEKRRLAEKIARSIAAGFEELLLNCSDL